MKSIESVQHYLDVATEGLRGDAELQREVRAELAAHLEDAVVARMAEGQDEADAVLESLRGMGEVLDTAASLQDANLRRMKWRGAARVGLQFVLAPLALVVALVVSNHLANGGVRLARELTNTKQGWNGSPGSSAEAPDDMASVDDAYLILHGDHTRKEPGGRERTLWERHPTNTVYLGNYITALLSGVSNTGGLDDDAIGELTVASEVEPENARFELLQASLRLDASATINEIPEKDRNGRLRHGLEVQDPEMFAHAMERLGSALEKPYLKRYAFEMLRLQHDALGSGQRFKDWIVQISISASMLLPDLSHYRQVERAQVSHGYTLLQAGNYVQARTYLDAWEPLARLLSRDAFTLIDVLVIDSILEMAEEGVADIYEEAGLLEDATRTRERAGRLRRGTKQWQDNRKTASGEDVMLKRGGIMCQLLMPALGIWPEADRYEANRRMEYTVVTELLVIGTSYVLVGMLIGCALIALRWWAGAASAAAIPILLVPSFRRMAWIVVCGVLFPFAMFLLITRFVPWSGHSYSFTYGGHKLIAEFGLLVTAWMVIPAWMTEKSVRERCLLLGVPVAPLMVRHMRWPLLAGMVGLVLIWLVPATMSDDPRKVVYVLAGLLLVATVVAAVLSFTQGLGGNRTFGLYYGTLSRSMIPTLALVVISLGLASSFFLVRAEVEYLANDSLVKNPGSGFTAIETELTDRLLQSLREGFDSLEE